MFCPKCGVKQEEDARFCSHCGKPLPVETEVETAEEQPVATPTVALPAVPAAPPPLSTAQIPVTPAVPPPPPATVPMPMPAPAEPTPPAAYPPPEPPKKCNVTCWLVGCLGLLALVILGIAVVAGFYWASGKPEKAGELSQKFQELSSKSSEITQKLSSDPKEAEKFANYMTEIGKEIQSKMIK